MLELGRQFEGGLCRAIASDLRLRVSESGIFTYPAVLVVRGTPRFADDQLDTLLNPTLLIEVLSPSTRDYDRGQKFQHYRTIESLREYLTIAQEEPHIEHWVRQPGNAATWLLSEFTELSQSFALAAVPASLSLAGVYRQVFDA